MFEQKAAKWQNFTQFGHTAWSSLTVGDAVALLESV
jgi:hypothetical protein